MNYSAIIIYLVLALLLLADCWSEFVGVRMTSWSFATEAKIAASFFIIVKVCSALALILAAFR